MISKLLMTLLFAGSIVAQQPTPAPFNASNYIGGTQHSQTLSPNAYGQQIANLATDTPNMVSPLPADGAGNEWRVKQGAVLNMVSYSPYVDDTHPAPIVAIQTMGALPLPLPIIPAPFPGAAVGHDQIFSWGTPLTLTPAYSTPIINPFGPNNTLWIATMNVPTGVVGYVISTQWLRWDPTTNLWYLSNERHVRIAS